MIVLLRSLFENKSNIMTIEYVKNQLLQLYSQLSVCNEIPINTFLFIAQTQPIYIEVDEKYNIYGAITIIIEQKMLHDGGYVCHIEDVVVDKKYRNRELGKKLVNFAINHAKDKGCYKIILNCNEHVEPFYNKLGFQSKNKEMSIYFT